MQSNKDKVARMVRKGNTPVLPEESLEQSLMKHVLNPMKMIRSRESVVDGRRIVAVSKDTKEGMVINHYGVLEERKEEYTYVQILRDGTPVNKNGLTKCQTCGSIVNIENIRRCPCGQTCCISRNCGVYSKKKDEWYCCIKHASFSFFKINPRWFR